MTGSVTITARRHLRVVGAVVSCLLLLTGCTFEGLNSYVLPGTMGTEEDSYTVHVEIPNVGNLTRNAEVKIDNVAVGTVTGLAVRNWHAVVTVSLDTDTRLPANANAAVGTNSLLGASYLQLAPPKDEEPSGTLGDGDTIALERSDPYPSTEEVLASLSVVLNGSGLAQLETIVRELERALGGKDHAVARLLPTLDDFVSRLDAQRGDIVHAMESLNRLSGKIAGHRDVLGDAIDRITPALQVLERERPDLTRTLTTLDGLGRTAGRVIAASKDNIVANLRDLRPALEAIAGTGQDLVGALNLAGTFPFPASNVPNACRGDYCNVFVTLDLTLQTLDANLLSGTPLQGSLLGLQSLLGERAGPAAEAADPLQGPALTPQAPHGDGSTMPSEAPSERPAGRRSVLDSLLGGD